MKKNKQIINKINERIEHLKLHFDRYRKEVEKAREDKDKSQRIYSDNQSSKMLFAIDELTDLNKFISKKE